MQRHWKVLAAGGAVVFFAWTVWSVEMWIQDRRDAQQEAIARAYAKGLRDGSSGDRGLLGELSDRTFAQGARIDGLERRVEALEGARR